MVISLFFLSYLIIQLHSPLLPVTTQKFEEIFETLGSFRHWQRVIFCLISAIDIHGAFAILLPVFTGATPRWRCVLFEETGNSGSFKNGSDVENDTWGACQSKSGNSSCISVEFFDDFTSIVSEVLKY